MKKHKISEQVKEILRRYNPECLDVKCDHCDEYIRLVKEYDDYYLAENIGKRK